MLNNLEKYPEEFCYHKIFNLRKENLDFPYTQFQYDEIIKCSQDIEYFFRNYIWIINLDEGLIKFNPYDFQIDFVKSLQDERFVISKFPRQSGKTTSVGAFLCHSILFQEYTQIGVVANKQKTASEVCKKLQTMYLNLPLWMQQGVLNWGKLGFELENGSRMVVEPTSGTALSGYSISILYWDEMSKCPPNLANDFLASVYPTISSGTRSKIILTSTPIGYNHYAKFWHDAKNELNGFVPHEINWRDVPGRDEKFKIDTIAKIGQRLWDQEYECKFLGSSNTLIEGSRLEELYHVNPIKEMLGHDLKIYEEPHRNDRGVIDHTFVLVVDSSKGTGNDYHAFQIIDVSVIPWKQVAVYRNNVLDWMHYAPIVNEIVNMYGDNILLVCENNDIGDAVLKSLMYDLECNALVYAPEGGKPGLNMNVKTKKMGNATLKSLIENQKLEIIDFDTINELYRFVQSGTTFCAESGYNDDLAMGLVMFAFVSTTKMFSEFVNSGASLRETLFGKNQQRILDDLPCPGFSTNGSDLGPGEEIFDSNSSLF